MTTGFSTAPPSRPAKQPVKFLLLIERFENNNVAVDDETIYSLSCSILDGDFVPEVLIPPAPAFSWVFEWHVFEILGPVKLNTEVVDCSISI